MVDWELWVKGTGLAPVFLDFTTTELNQSIALATAYVNTGKTPSGYEAFNNYSSNLKAVFCDTLNSLSDSVTIEILDKIDTDLNITGTVDPEVKQRWFPLGLQTYYDNVTEPAHEFISSMGRMKYLTPIYQALVDSGN
jgi:leukotriene-A4 hydrolase